MNKINRRAFLRNLLVSAGVILIGLGLFFVLIYEPDRLADIRAADTNSEPPSLSRIDGVPAEDVWIEQAEARLGKLEQRSDQLEKENQHLRTENERLQVAQEQLLQDAKEVIDNQARLIETMITAPPTTPDSYSNPFVPDVVSDASTTPVIADSPPLEPPQQQNAEVLPLQVSAMQFFELASLEKNNSDQPTEPVVPGRDPQFWLPAGSFAPAIITAGAAAAVSATGQSDPRPVVMRITGSARSAADEQGRVIETDIRGCTITGEARGDLSSERVYVRLQIMTCLTKSERIVETQVRGFVAGAGQAGVRGPVISREGDLVEKGFMAGVFGGFGDAASQGLRQPQLTFGENVPMPTDTAILGNAGRAGIATGIGRAGNLLADYYISRAEQYQPVVSLRAGTPVDVIFIAGADVSGKASAQ